MGEITDIGTLLKKMKPEREADEFVYCKLESEEVLSRLAINPPPRMVYREEEGITVIIKKEQAETRAIPYEFVAACITLSVHSDLNAVGFLAAISQKLAEAKISCNVVSAYYHDHLFVPTGKANEALSILKKLGEN